MYQAELVLLLGRVRSAREYQHLSGEYGALLQSRRIRPSCPIALLCVSYMMNEEKRYLE